MINIRSKREIEKLDTAGKIVAEVHELLKEYVKPGISTKELDEIAEKRIRKLGATPAFKGYHGFKGSICSSINEQVVHGIPSKNDILKEGDIISIDIGSLKDGYYGDAARTHGVGKISEEKQRLIDVTRQSFYEGLKFCKVGYRLFDISHAVQVCAESNGFSIVRDFVGHGVGTELHEDPQIPNYGKAGRGPRLQAGMVIAVEPMVNMGRHEVKILSDGWTVVTIDGKPSAHYEHTIAITDSEPILLTSLD